MRPFSLARTVLMLAAGAACSSATAAAAAGAAWLSGGGRHMLQKTTAPAAGFLPPAPRTIQGRAGAFGVQTQRQHDGGHGRVVVAMSAVGNNEESERERQRQQQEQLRLEARPVPDFVADANKKIVSSIKDALVAVYGDRHYARFHALETIARVPYFAYTSVLHLYETLGWRRRADLMKIHFAESWNELHHLLIMEELGGNDRWADRVIAVHLAFFYYWVAIAVYMTSPETAYNLNEQVERHAFDTYDKFLQAHEAELKAQPAPQVAKQYYETGDLYMFDEFHTTSPSERRRPHIETLYDVFVNIRNDEREHFLTMEAMQQRAEPDVVSPNSLGGGAQGKEGQGQQQGQQQRSSASWSTVKQRQKAEEE